MSIALSRRRGRLPALALALLSAAILASCTCGRPFVQPSPRGPAAAAPPAAAPDYNKLLPPNVDPTLRQQCIDSCKTLCKRAQDCDVPSINQPPICARVCLFLCGRGVMDEELRGCVKPETACPVVKQCAQRIGERVHQIRDGKVAAAPVAPPTPATPAAAGNAPAAGTASPPAPIPGKVPPAPGAAPPAKAEPAPGAGK